MNLWQDVRFGARLLVKDRWFTLAAATALALGIGANAAVFTFVNAVILRSLPFHEPDHAAPVECSWTLSTIGTRRVVSKSSATASALIPKPKYSSSKPSFRKETLCISRSSWM